jgi:Domain of unknown function (DUF4281)
MESFRSGRHIIDMRRQHSQYTAILLVGSLWYNSYYGGFIGFPQGAAATAFVPRWYGERRQSVRQQHTTTHLHLLVADPVGCMDTAAIMAASSLSSVIAAPSFLLCAAVTVSPEPIHTAFTVATFAPQPFWLLMILLPNSTLTKRIMGGMQVPLLLCAVHLLIVLASLSADGGTAPLAEFNDVFDLSGDPQKAFIGMTSNYPNFVAEEWSHVLTWDLFVGRYIWLDGVQRNILTAPSVLLCNLIGPPGLILHWITCAVSGKPLVDDQIGTD